MVLKRTFCLKPGALTLSLLLGGSLFGGLSLLWLGSSLLLGALSLLFTGRFLGLGGLLSGSLLGLLFGLLGSGDLEGSRSSLSLGLDDGLLLDQGLQSLLDEGGQLDGVNLVVGGDVLLDGGQGGAIAFLEGLDGGYHHDGGLGVSGFGLGSLGLSGFNGGLGGVGHPERLCSSQ